MALSKLAVRRLTKLADYMDTVPRDHFHMRDWVAHAGDTQIAGVHRIKKPSDIKAAIVECGMTACALGHAAMIPAFTRAGLVLKRDGFRGFFPALKDTNDGDTTAMRFFDIDMARVDYLFRADHITTPKQWAKHCRKFIKENS